MESTRGRHELRTHLQELRDWAERSSRAWALTSRDNADAWERIGLALDGAQSAIADDWRLLTEVGGCYCPAPVPNLGQTAGHAHDCMCEAC